MRCRKYRGGMARHPALRKAYGQIRAHLLLVVLLSAAVLIAAGAVTQAFSVAKLTVAVTPSSLFSFFSTRAAHEAQVIPPIDNSTERSCPATVVM